MLLEYQATKRSGSIINRKYTLGTCDEHRLEQLYIIYHIYTLGTSDEHRFDQVARLATMKVN